MGPNGSHQPSAYYGSYAGSHYPSSFTSAPNAGYGGAYLGGNVSAPPAYQQLSLSTPVTEICGNCRKPHVPDPERMVTDPRTRKRISTCSTHCQKMLLKSMMAIETVPAQAAPSYASALPVVASSAPRASIPTVVASSRNNAPASVSTGYQGGAHAHFQHSSFAPTNSHSGSHSTPHHSHSATNSQYVQPAPHYVPHHAQHTLPAKGYAQTASHFSSAASSTPQYGHAPSSSFAHSHQHHSAPTRVHSAAASKHDKRSGNAQVPSSLNSKASVQVTVNSLELQLQKWIDQRQNLPPLWGVRTVILDTNVLLDFPDLLHDLHLLFSDLLFIVPFVLVQELDALKTRAHGPKYAARQAISRLHEMLVQPQKKDEKIWVRGQRPHERLSLEGALQTTSGDDRILECVNYFHTYSTGGKKVMLLTHDKNLQLKASILGMKTGGVAQLKEFFEGYTFLINERKRLQLQLTSARATSDVESMRIPDWKLEDYAPELETEDDEFAQAKREADAAAAAVAADKAKAERTAEEASKHAAMHADALSRLPEGTRTDLYEDSSVESPALSPRGSHHSTSPRPMSPAQQLSHASISTVSDSETSPRSSSTKGSESNNKKDHSKDKKNKSKKRKEKSKEKKQNAKKRARESSDDETSHKKTSPEIILID